MGPSGMMRKNHLIKLTFPHAHIWTHFSASTFSFLWKDDFLHCVFMYFHCLDDFIVNPMTTCSLIHDMRLLTNKLLSLSLSLSLPLPLHSFFSLRWVTWALTIWCNALKNIGVHRYDRSSCWRGFGRRLSSKAKNQHYQAHRYRRQVFTNSGNAQTNWKHSYQHFIRLLWTAFPTTWKLDKESRAEGD